MTIILNIITNKKKLVTQFSNLSQFYNSNFDQFNFYNENHYYNKKFKKFSQLIFLNFCLLFLSHIDFTIEISIQLDFAKFAR